MIQRHYALATFAILAGCAEAPTQTVVRFRAHSSFEVPADATIQFWLWPHGAAQFESPIDIGTYAFFDDIKVPVEPAKNDARRRFTLFAELRRGEELLSWARVRAGFEQGEISEVRIELAPGCPAPSDREISAAEASCGSHDTCVVSGAGVQCAPSCFSLDPFVDSAAREAPSAPGPCAEPDCLEATALEASFNATCALAEGRMFCWGDIPGLARRYPSWVLDESGVATHDPARPFAGVALGARHLCGLRDGMLYCGGSDPEGQLGNGDGLDADCCGEVATTADGSPLTGVRSVAAEANYVCAITDEDTVWCAGNAPIMATSSPVFVPTEHTGITSLAAGRLFACVAGSDEVRCQGNGPPTSVPIGWNDEVIAARAETLCLSDAAGTTRCWGEAADDTPFSTQPQMLTHGYAAIGIAARNFSEPSARCGIDKESRSLRCWGINDENGRMGVEPAEAMSISEANAIEVGDGRYQALRLGRQHGCALDEGGGVWCWGANDRGQLGVDGPSGAEMRSVCLPSW